MEITSTCTVSEDQGVKRGLYAFLGIEEYWQFDPTGDYLVPPLKGMRLVEGNYWPMPVREGGDGTRIGTSAVLGLELRLCNGELHFHDQGSGATLLTYAELAQARELAERGIESAERARDSAEQARQTAEMAQRHAEQALQVAETRAEADARERTAAETRAAAAEARIAELQARLSGDR